MARYMAQFSYHTEAISALVKNPQDRAAVVRALIENWGGRLEAFYFTFGDYDGVAIAEAPDNVTMAAVSMAVTATGAFKTFKTTVLISPEEAMEAMGKAGTVSYQAPGG